MPSQPPLPSLLTPYVSSLPLSSLTLLSSVLGATGNWLIVRYLYAALNAFSNAGAGSVADGLDGRKKKVVLVSFLRGWDFWRAEAKRLGLDLARLAEKGQFAFVDGLSELFYVPTAASAAPAATAAASVATPSASSSGIPRQTVLPARGPPVAAPAPAPARQSVAGPGTGPIRAAATEIGPAKKLHLTGQGTAALDTLEKDIQGVIEKLKTTTEGEDVLLIVDQPDFLLAAMAPGKGIGATEMNEWIMGLQEHAYATIVAVSADSQLIHNAVEQATPLVKEHAAFAVGLAHRAEMVVQLRNLETGAARDVSGVLRASKGGAWGQSSGSNDAENQWEKEVLYFIQRDGSVNIFGRGE